MTKFTHLEPPQFILASASPRRSQLLQQLGLGFAAMPADVDETLPGEGLDPARIVQTLARMKAESVADRHPDALVIGADTVVVLDGDVLGKPRDELDARAMLARLSGRAHEVHTGVALARRRDNLLAVESEMTRVTFGDLSEETIAAYAATQEPLDKAGGYGIQGLGATLVKRVEGCYFNVVGLPIFRLNRMLERLGVSIVSISNVNCRQPTGR